MKKIRLWKNKDELSDKYTLVDDEDYEKVVEAKDKRGKPKKWYCHNNNSSSDYATSGDRRNSIHRLVMGSPKGMCVDHINGDTLDNRKENLRVCTRSQNSQNQKIKSHNQSGYKGVYYSKNPFYEKFLKEGPALKKDGTIKKVQPKPYAKPWVAYIGGGQGKSPIRLGCHATAEEAAEVRDKKALEIHGEFARLNFPDKREEYLEEMKNER